MTIRELISELNNIKEELKDKEVMVIAENGLHLPARIIYYCKDVHSGTGFLEKTKDNVEYIIIYY